MFKAFISNEREREIEGGGGGEEGGRENRRQRMRGRMGVERIYTVVFGTSVKNKNKKTARPFEYPES